MGIMTTKEDLLKTTQSLIRFRSTESRPDQINACADFIADFFAETDLVVERFTFNGVPSVVVTKGTKTPTIFLNGHFDVVEGEDEQFDPCVKDGVLFGRGSLDMKSGDAVMMHLMRDLADTAHHVGLMLTGDEEVGGFNGTAKLLEAGYACDVVLIPDGGEAVHQVISKGKGVLRVSLSAEGKNAHGSMPWEGENAIERIAHAVEVVCATFPSLASHPADHWVTTCTVGKISGGVVVNQVPNKAVAECDIRYTEEDPPEAIMERIRSVLPEGVVAHQTIVAPNLVVPMEHPLVRTFADALRAEGRDMHATLDHGASDGRFFATKHIPVIMSQPDGGNLHAPGEWVNIDSMELYYRVLSRFIQEIS